MEKANWSSLEKNSNIYLKLNAINIIKMLDKLQDTTIAWLTESGVCYQGLNNTVLGGIFAGYDTEHSEWTFIYNEITGYAISMFCTLYKKTGNKTYLDYANSSASFILRHQIQQINCIASGAFYKGFSTPDYKPITSCYTFDAAMIIQGLLDLYQITKDNNLKDAANRAGNWLISMQCSSGAFYAYYDFESSSIEHPGPFFYQDYGCLHAKHAISLLKLFSVTGDTRFEDAAKKVCDWVLLLQDEDGAFWVNQSHSHVYAHAHCYATEGLVFAYSHFKDHNYMTAILKATAWLKNNINQKHLGILGTFKCAEWFSSTETIAQKKWAKALRTIYPRLEIATDATFQSARLFLLLDIIKGQDTNLILVNKIVDKYLSEVLNTESYLTQKGGLHSRIDISLFSVRKSPIIATWGVQFYLSTKLLLEDLSNGNKSDLLINELF